MIISYYLQICKLYVIGICCNNKVTSEDIGNGFPRAVAGLGAKEEMEVFDMGFNHIGFFKHGMVGAVGILAIGKRVMMFDMFHSYIIVGLVWNV